MTTYQQPQFASASVPLETFSFSRSSTGRSTNTIDWAIASKLDTEYDADAEDALLSQSRPTGWKGYLMKGGLGIYLLSTNKGWHVYVGLLSFSVAASGCGLLTLNWLVLVGMPFFLRSGYVVLGLTMSFSGRIQVSLLSNCFVHRTVGLSYSPLVVCELHSACVHATQECRLGNCNCALILRSSYTST